MISASGCITRPADRPPIDLGCDTGAATCSGSCPDLPAWTSGDFDDLLALGAQDRLTLEACQAKLRACQACLDRGKAAGVLQ